MARTLVDAFLDDLEDDFDVDDAGDVAVHGDGKVSSLAANGLAEGASKEDAVRKSITTTSLRFAERFIEHMKRIEVIDELASDEDAHNAVVDSNRMILDLEEEIVRFHKHTQSVYAAKFPELAKLVPKPLEYSRAVLEIGNEMDLTTVDLTSILASAQIMVVCVSGSTTSGVPLSASALVEATDAAREVLKLHDAKVRIEKFVADRMSITAPNVSALLGCAVAAKLLGSVGGLDALSMLPSCNVHAVGHDLRKHLGGFSSATVNRHAGIIFDAPVVQQCPEAVFQKKAARVLAGRVTLAARVDMARGDPTGSKGDAWRADIESKIAKWLGPGKGKTKRALPVPTSGPKKRRGGKRYRKMKEKYELSDVQKQANRLAFGEGSDEYGDAAMGLSLGMAGKAGSGKLRLTQRSASKAPKKPELRAISGAGGVSGMSSTLAFTPIQGIELVDPEARAKKVREANLKYFGTVSGFSKRS